MFNCGMAAIELPTQSLDVLFGYSGYGDTVIAVDIEAEKISIRGGGREDALSFQISPFDKALVLAGGWVDYADSKY